MTRVIAIVLILIILALLGALEGSHASNDILSTELESCQQVIMLGDDPMYRGPE